MNTFRKFLGSALIIAITIVTTGIYPSVALAASLLNKSDTLSSQIGDAVSNHTFVFRTPTGVDATGDTITIDLDDDFVTTGVAFGDVDLDVSAGSQSTCDSSTTYGTSKTLAASAASSVWGVAVNTSTDVITLTAPTNAAGGEIAANACVRIKVGTNASGGTNQITNASVSGCSGSSSSCIIAVAGVFGDSGNIVVNMLSNDQVSVSAAVAESLTFTVSDNSIGFGTLSASAARYATGDTSGSASETSAHTLVVGTNASNGYTMSVNGATLTSGSNTITAIGSSNTASSAGTEQFGLRMTASGGSGAVTAPYAASGFAFDTAAFPDQVASSATASTDTTYSVYYLANITSSTEAGAYTATLTYVATANF